MAKIVIYFWFLIFSNLGFSQFGRVLSSIDSDHTINFGERPKSSFENLQINSLPARLNDNNTTITNLSTTILTNKNYKLFEIHQNKLLNHKDEIVDSEKPGLITCDISIVLPFSNRKYRILGNNIDTFSSKDSIFQFKLKQLFIQDIYAHDARRIIVNTGFHLLDADETIQDLSYSRINDSSYLVAAATNRTLYMFNISSYTQKLLAKIDLSVHLMMVDSSEIVSKKYRKECRIDNLVLSHDFKYLAINYREEIFSLVKQSLTYYTIEKVRSVGSLKLLTLDIANWKVIRNKIVSQYDFPNIFNARSYLDFSCDFKFDPLSKYLYYDMRSGPSGLDTSYVKRYFIEKDEEEIIVKFSTVNSKRFTKVFNLTYWGEICIWNCDGIKKESSIVRVINPSAKFNELILKEISGYSTYSLLNGAYAPPPMVHNYLYIKPEITTACKARVKFRNFTNMERGFTRFEYHIAKDTAGKKWDVLTEFEPEYVFQEKGKYAFKVRGFCDDGYSEWYEDSVIIEAGEQFDVLPNHTPIIQFASTDNNKQNSIQWQSLSGATEYSIFKDNVFIGRTTQTKLLDSMKDDIQGPHEYHVVAHDACMHSSAKSATAKTIFLTVRKESSNNVLLERSELEWNEYANGSDLVLSYEGYSSIVNENWWQKMYTGTPTTTVDAQFVTFGKEGKCYRVEGNLSSGFKTSSNEACLFYSEKVLIPTAFTPNGDGLNDAFEISGNGISGIEMAIYNRWGEKIHSDNGKNIRWQPQNTIPSNEMYTYVIRCRFSNGGWEVYKGTVLLLR
jgi:gliding motility-associated-like protein